MKTRLPQRPGDTDKRTILRHLGIDVPNNFGKKEDFMYAAMLLWRAITHELWERDIGVYKTAVLVATYCEHRGT